MLANPSRDAVYIEDCYCDKETEKALLVHFDDEAHWIPKSCLHEDSEVEGEGDSGRLAVKKWFAEKEGLA